MNLIDIIMRAREMGASDVHFGAGSPVFFRTDGALVAAPYEIDDEQKERMVLGLLDGGQRAWFDEGNDVDMALATPDGNRQRVNVFRTSGGVCAAIRLLDNEIPTIAELGLPPVVTQLAELPRGLVLVTGPTGSGKSTTLASMVDYVNENFAKHVITVEDPIEYVYEQKRALIQQREVGRDVKGFAGSLRSALREDPDIILVGEMRDHETIAAALTAAETGHLVRARRRDHPVPRAHDRRREVRGNRSAYRHRRCAQHRARRQVIPAFHRDAVGCGSGHAHAQRRPG